MPARLPYNSETIDRALAAHHKSGLIGSWIAGDRDRRVVTLASGDLFDLRDNREAYVFIRGLVTASDAARLAGSHA